MSIKEMLYLLLVCSLLGSLVQGKKTATLGVCGDLRWLL